MGSFTWRRECVFGMRTGKMTELVRSIEPLVLTRAKDAMRRLRQGYNGSRSSALPKSAQALRVTPPQAAHNPQA